MVLGLELKFKLRFLFLKISPLFIGFLFLFFSSSFFSCKTKEVVRNTEKQEIKKIKIWGTAISGFQADMGPEVPPDTKSDWWVWMHDEENQISKRVGEDKPEDGPAFWKNYRDDLELAKQIGTNYFRYSIEWSRVFSESTTDIPADVEFTEDGFPKKIKISSPSISELEKRANQENIKKYREILEYAKKIGLKIFLTLNHFTLPIWIHDPISCRDWFKSGKSGPICFGKPAGWLSQETIIEFAKYSAFLAYKFGDIVDLWGPMNEPIVVSTSGYLAGDVGILAGVGSFPPSALDVLSFEIVTKNLIFAFARSYDAIKEYDIYDEDGDGKKSVVSLIYNIPFFEPESQSAQDIEATEKAWFVQVFWFLDAILKGVLRSLDGKTEKFYDSLKSRADIVGINYYNRIKIKYVPIVPEKNIVFLPKFPACPSYEPSDECPYGMSEGGWEIYPPGIYEVIKAVWKRYKDLGLPIMITENGIADAKDLKRPEFIKEHVKFVKKALDEGIPILGYFYWSLIDNLEWNSGYGKKFGLIEVDFSSPERKRTLRKSAFTFKEIIEKEK
ncbi:MAG: family 1 glycosylhydrolase [Candidatus Calescibacterium sp.]